MRLVRLRDDEGTRTALIGEPGRKFTPYVTLGFPIKLQKIENTVVDRSTTDLAGSVKQAAKRYRLWGRQHGATKGARQFLKGV